MVLMRNKKNYHQMFPLIKSSEFKMEKLESIDICICPKHVIQLTQVRENHFDFNIIQKEMQDYYDVY